MSAKSEGAKSISRRTFDGDLHRIALVSQLDGSVTLLFLNLMGLLGLGMKEFIGSRQGRAKYSSMFGI